jgi:hypothetical protein
MHVLPSDIINKLSIFWEKAKLVQVMGLPNQINIFMLTIPLF